MLLLAAVTLSGCTTFQSPSLTGEWELRKDGEVQADLIFGPGDNFHVDLPAVEGIEVKGITHVEGREITFFNESGTDAIASDPTPGTYLYSIEGDTLRFEKISDPLERRAKFLSQPWTRVATKE